MLLDIIQCLYQNYRLNLLCAMIMCLTARDRSTLFYIVGITLCLLTCGTINTDDVWSTADHGVLRQYTMIRRTPYIISINNDTFLHNGNDNDLFFTPTLQCNIIEHEAKVVEFYEACHPISERETTL